MIAALSTALALAAGRPPACAGPTTTRRSHPMMATVVTISVHGCASPALEDAIAQSFAAMQRLAGQLSEWEPQSPVSQLSARAGGPPQPVPTALFEVLAAGKAASAATDGAFDVTWAALGGLWHFSEGEAPHLPAEADVARQVALVGDRDLLLDPAAQTAQLRRAGMRVGLGGLAKGYIAQAGADALVAAGYPNVLVAASGDLTARGRNGTRPWVAALQDPRDPSRSVATVELRDESLSTAGDYERCFFAGGRRYHHILDPRTGWPAEGTASVSVLARRGVWADALDTGLLVLGPAKGPRAANQLPEIGALFVFDDGAISVAGPWGDRFRVAPAAVAQPRPETQLAPPAPTPLQ